MHKIILKHLSLINFKGVAQQEINFSEEGNQICGENGTGKTTIFDAFLWLLFGKDSTGRSDSNFQIKTLDKDGKPILRLEHSVAAVLDVDGNEMKLQRNYVENWVKPRGTTEEYLKDHKTECYINDVKVGTKKEYDLEVGSLIDEELFRLITNPFYFTSLKADKQKEILLAMAGDVSDEEVAKIKPEYIELLAQLSGRTLAQYAKEVAAKKRACKEELAVIPSQIDTANRLKPAVEDWRALEAEIQAKNNKIAEIDAQLADKSKINEAEYARKTALQQQIGNKRVELANVENEIRAKANAGRNEVTLQIKDLEYKVQAKDTEIKHTEAEVQRLQGRVEDLEQSIVNLRNQYKAEHRKEVEYPEGAFVCPTCKRPLEVDDIEAKQREIQANFNEQKAQTLKKIQDRGKALGAEQAKEKEAIALNEAKIQTLKGEREKLELEIEQRKSSIPEAQNVDLLLSSDQRCIDLKNQIVELENQVAMEGKVVDLSDLQGAKKEITTALAELQQRIANKKQIERVEAEVKALEEKQLATNQALADLEKWEFAALDFQKDKDNALQAKINDLFQVVSFKFVQEQLNGGEKLTCTCTVNGTPYSDVNFAGKVNAGLDIINALCNSYSVSAPIFIDNRESVNEIIKTVSQVINLRVSNDKVLTIK